MDGVWTTRRELSKHQYSHQYRIGNLTFKLGSKIAQIIKSTEVESPPTQLVLLVIECYQYTSANKVGRKKINF